MFKKNNAIDLCDEGPIDLTPQRVTNAKKRISTYVVLDESDNETCAIKKKPVSVAAKIQEKGEAEEDERDTPMTKVGSTPMVRESDSETDGEIQETKEEEKLQEEEASSCESDASYCLDDQAIPEDLASKDQSADAQLPDLEAQQDPMKESGFESDSSFDPDYEDDVVVFSCQKDGQDAVFGSSEEEDYSSKEDDFPSTVATSMDKTEIEEPAEEQEDQPLETEEEQEDEEIEKGLEQEEEVEGEGKQKVANLEDCMEDELAADAELDPYDLHPIVFPKETVERKALQHISFGGTVKTFGNTLYVETKRNEVLASAEALNLLEPLNIMQQVYFAEPCALAVEGEENSKVFFEYPLGAPLIKELFPATKIMKANFQEFRYDFLVPMLVGLALLKVIQKGPRDVRKIFFGGDGRVYFFNFSERDFFLSVVEMKRLRAAKAEAREIEKKRANGEEISKKRKRISSKASYHSSPFLSYVAPVSISQPKKRKTSKEENNGKEEEEQAEMDPLEQEIQEEFIKDLEREHSEWKENVEYMNIIDRALALGDNRKEVKKQLLGVLDLIKEDKGTFPEEFAKDSGIVIEDLIASLDADFSPPKRTKALPKTDKKKKETASGAN